MLRTTSVFLLQTLALVSVVFGGEVGGTGQVIPQVALGGPFEGVLRISNKAEEAFTGKVFLLTGNAEPWGGEIILSGESVGNVIDLGLPGKATREMRLSGGKTITEGYINISNISGTQSWINLAVSFFYVLKNDGQITDSIGVKAAHIPNRQTVAEGWAAFTGKYSIPVKRGGGADTGIAVTHGLREPVVLSGGIGNIHATLYDEAGTAVRMLDMANDGHDAMLLSDMWNDLPADFVGLLQLEPDDFETIYYVTVIGIQLTGGMQPSGGTGFQLTSLPPDDVYSLELFVSTPVIGDPIW